MTLALVAAAAFAFAQPMPAAAAAYDDAKGTKSVLVVLATWGPQPFTGSQVAATMRDVASWYAETSYGKLTIKAPDVTPWLTIPSYDDCETGGVEQGTAFADRAAAAAGFDPAKYDLVTTVFPKFKTCSWTGLGGNGRAWFNSAIYPFLFEHELGHAIGLAHSVSTPCSVVDASCTIDEYGDSYDVMGSGAGHFNACQKNQLGWLDHVQNVGAPGAYLVDQLEQSTSQTQALRIQAGDATYWVEHREKIGSDAQLGKFSPAPFDGVLLHIETDGRCILLTPLPGAPSFVLGAGETYFLPGVFSLTVADHVGSHVDVSFAWDDEEAPDVQLVAPGDWATVKASPTFSWKNAVDNGSGLDHYLLSVDGSEARTIAADKTTFTWPSLLATGAHTWLLVAVDRAGNQGPATGVFNVAPPVKAKPKPKPVKRKKSR